MDTMSGKILLATLECLGMIMLSASNTKISLMSANEGLQKAITFLKEVMTFEDKGACGGCRLKLKYYYKRGKCYEGIYECWVNRI